MWHSPLKVLPDAGTGPLAAPRCPLLATKRAAAGRDDNRISGQLLLAWGSGSRSHPSKKDTTRPFLKQKKPHVTLIFRHRSIGGEKGYSKGY